MQNERIIRDNTANPAPLGLLGFAMTTILLNIHNAGFFELNAMIISMGIFMGGIPQIIVGFQEWKKNNTFGATAFTAYGFFWLSLVAIWLMPSYGITKSSAFAVGFYLLIWGMFSLAMFIGTLKMNKALQLTFGSLVILFFMLAVADFTGSEQIRIIAGYEGIICGLFALYASIAQVLNEVYNKELLPLGVVSK